MNIVPICYIVISLIIIKYFGYKWYFFFVLQETTEKNEKIIFSKYPLEPIFYQKCTLLQYFYSTPTRKNVYLHKKITSY